MYSLQGRHIGDPEGQWSDDYCTGAELTLEKAEESIRIEEEFDARNGMRGAYEYRAVPVDE